MSIMKKLAVFALFLFSVLLLAQEKSLITVKDSTVATGVVIVTAQWNGKTAELQCNQGSPFCTQLKKGAYVLVQLPKNHGMYDCQCADVYPESVDPNADPNKDQRLGQYCLTVK
jgi:hypothetical protein